MKTKSPEKAGLAPCKRLHCACVFERKTFGGKAKQIEECGFHESQRKALELKLIESKR